MVQICLFKRFVLKTIFFIIFISFKVNAGSDLKLYYDNTISPKTKLPLIIKDKLVEKKVKASSKMLYAVGSRGKNGVTPKGGYCVKFEQTTVSYKKVKVAEQILIPLFNNCFNNIESYSNSNDNISDILFNYQKYFGTDEVRMFNEIDFLGKGDAGKLEKTGFKMMSLNKVDNIKGEMSLIWAYPIFLNDPNNNTLNKFIDDNLELDEKDFVEAYMPIFASSSASDHVSLMMQDKDVEKVYKDENYLYLCSEFKFVGNSFRQENVGDVILDVSKINKIKDIFDKLNMSFGRYKKDEYLNDINLTSKLDKIFDKCEGIDFMKINIQNRN